MRAEQIEIPEPIKKKHFGNCGSGSMVASSRYPRGLWSLLESGGKMERSRLRSKASMRYSQLNPIHDELVKEGRIKISGEIITIRQRID